MSKAIIHAAAEKGDLATINRILDADPSQVHSFDARGQQPLHSAAFKGKVDVIELLLERGADINALDKHSTTPLSYAVDSDKLKAVEYLVSRGADVNLGAERRKPLLWAAVTRRKMFDLLLAHGAFYDFESAVLKKDKRRVKELLVADPELIRRLDKEIQAKLLNDANVEKGEHIMRLLLEHGLDPNITFPGAFSDPVITRVRTPTLAELLLQHGARLDVKGGVYRLTPVQYAEKHEMHEFLEVYRKYLPNK